MTAVLTGLQISQSSQGQSHSARTAQESAGTAGPARSLVSHHSADPLGGVSVILSVMHGTDMLIPGNPIFP